MATFTARKKIMKEKVREQRLRMSGIVRCPFHARASAATLMARHVNREVPKSMLPFLDALLETDIPSLRWRRVLCATGNLPRCFRGERGAGPL